MYENDLTAAEKKLQKTEKTGFLHKTRKLTNKTFLFQNFVVVFEFKSYMAN